MNQTQPGPQPEQNPTSQRQESQPPQNLPLQSETSPPKKPNKLIITGIIFIAIAILINLPIPYYLKGNTINCLLAENCPRSRWNLGPSLIQRFLNRPTFGSPFEESYTSTPTSTPSITNTLTSNWRTYTNHLYQFSFIYPPPEENLFYSYNDNTSFSLFANKLSNPGNPWLQIAWYNQANQSELDYIKSKCPKTSSCNHPLQTKPVTINNHQFYSYTKNVGSITAVGLVIKHPTQNLIFEIYDYDFPDSIKNQILSSIDFSLFQSPELLTHNTSFAQFTYPSNWQLVTSWQNLSAAVSNANSAISIRIDSFDYDQNDTSKSDKEKFDYINQYKFGSTAWYGDDKQIETSESAAYIDGRLGYTYRWILSEPYGETTWIYIPDTNRIITIEKSGKDLTTLNQILSTFKFLD